MMQEPEEDASDLYTHRHDPDEWEEATTPAKIRPLGTSVISCRLPTDEFHALEAAAQAAGEKLSEYMRKAILLRRQQSTATVLATYNISFGGQYLQQEDKWSTWTTAAASFVPEDASQPLQKVDRQTP